MIGNNLSTSMLRGLQILVLPLFVFGAFLVLVGVNPVETYVAMFTNALSDMYGLGEVAVRATPVILAALATALPARAGLINVGGEGQLVMGALTATAAALAVQETLPGPVALLVAGLAGMAGGAAWAGLAGCLRVFFKLNETITTLLLNYVACLFVGFIIHGPLKDPNSFNWPFSPPLADSVRLAALPGSRFHAGFVVALIAAVAIWFLAFRTAWGFRLRVVGGNVQSALRAGFHVNRILLLSMLVGGAVAGLGGMVEVCGVEGRLRPATGLGLGYVGFLAAWMARQHPGWIIVTSFLLSAIAVSGDTLQIFANLPASSVNILMASILLCVLAGIGRKRHVH